MYIIFIRQNRNSGRFKFNSMSWPHPKTSYFIQALSRNTKQSLMTKICLKFYVCKLIRGNWCHNDNVFIDSSQTVHIVISTLGVICFFNYIPYYLNPDHDLIVLLKIVFKFFGYLFENK